MWDGELALITSQEEAYFKLNRPPHLGSDIDLSSRGVMVAPQSHEPGFVPRSTIPSREPE